MTAPRRVGAVGIVALVIAAVAAGTTAAGRPTCLVSNERTGVGFRSMQDAVDAASPGDTLVIKGTCDSEDSIVLITKSLRLEGASNPAFGTATVTANFDVLVILGDVTVVVDRLTIHAGVAEFSGGGIYTDFGTVTLNRSTVTGGRAAEGGGIYNFSGTVVLNESSVTGNVATNGGGIFNVFGSITLNHSTVSGNSARDWEGGEGINNGGGIYAHSGTITCNDSTISGNSATDQGGGIYNVGATLINCVSGVNVTGNTPSNIYP